MVELGSFVWAGRYLDGTSDRAESAKQEASLSRLTWCDYRGLIMASTIFVGVWTAGCLSVPVHVQPQTQGPKGSGGLVDPATIQLGVTTREQVVKNWGWGDTQVPCDRLFISEIKRSTERRVETVGVVPLDTFRVWEDQYLFVAFDEKGLVSRTHFSSHNHLYREMLLYVTGTPLKPMDFLHPVEINGRFGFRGRYGGHDIRDGTLRLLPDAMEYVPGPESKTSSPVRIGASQIEEFNDGMTFHSLLLSGLPHGHNRLEFFLKPAEAFTLFRYLQQVAPDSLRRPRASETKAG